MVPEDDTVPGTYEYTADALELAEPSLVLDMALARGTMRPVPMTPGQNGGHVTVAPRSLVPYDEGREV